MSKFPSLTNTQIERISRTLGEYMTGSDLTRIFEYIHIEDTSNESTKWKRIYYTFIEEQSKTSSSNAMFRFISESASPVRFLDNKTEHSQLIDKLNETLSFSGIEINEKGEFHIVKVAQTISEAQRRAQSIISKLQQRNVHNRIFQYCKEELLQENYFHAIFEATKGLAEFVRERTGLREDGAALYDKAFSLGDPYIVMNNLQAETDKKQQGGLCMMLKGINSMVRNVTAHEPKIKWIVYEEDAVDILVVISFLHKNLDMCHVVKHEQ